MFDLSSLLSPFRAAEGAGAGAEEGSVVEDSGT